MRIKFEDVEGQDLIIDCVYAGGNQGNYSSEPLIKLLPKCGSSGGFRKVNRTDGSKKPAYVILYTTMSELEWPDYLDEETGVFRYYGDNRKPGRSITDTKPKGNQLLEDVFTILNSNENLEDMPPFFIFKKTGEGRNVQFLGLAAPGNPNISPEKDLVSFWRTLDGKRFQNYKAYFTVLDTKKQTITQKWLKSLIYDHENNLRYAPQAWIDYVKNGRDGITPLKSPKINDIPSKEKQLQCDEEGMKCLEIIRKHYGTNSEKFELCATNLICKMDRNFRDFKISKLLDNKGTSGKYQINQEGTTNISLTVDCALEARCYNSDKGVNLNEMLKLISRTKNNQFGVFITTSYVNKQAYKEVIEENHPILIVTASDIGAILRSNSINSKNIEEWLDTIDKNI